jgi:uncharacterized protein (DUF697 family)
MPSLRRGSGPGIGSLGTIRNFVSVLREISFDDVRDEAETPPRLLVLAPDVPTARRLGLRLTGPTGELAVMARELNAPLAELGRFDAVIVFDPDRTGAVARARDRLPVEGGEAPVLALDGENPEDESALERLRMLLVSRLPDRAPAFGRAFPPFRAAAAKAVVDETARANAQFALVSNIPAVVPIVGSLASAGADFLVLTKNQLMMMFKIAAIHNRDLHDQRGLFQELIPVVGAGFVWRTIAREAASFIPFAAGTIPKVAIAYAGTLSTGRAADFYYRTNRRPSRDQIEGFYRQAVDAARKLPLPLPGGAEPESSANEVAAASEPQQNGAEGRSGPGSVPRRIGPPAVAADRPEGDAGASAEH